mgnify:FL=1
MKSTNLIHLTQHHQDHEEKLAGIKKEEDMELLIILLTNSIYTGCVLGTSRNDGRSSTHSLVLFYLEKKHGKTINDFKFSEDSF